MTLLDALQAALAAEQAIVYGYGVVGANLPESDQTLVSGIWNSHRRRRDLLAELISGLGGSPVAARPAYALPFPVHSDSAARRLAGHLERGGSGAAWNLVAVSSAHSRVRRIGVEWLSTSATDEATLTGSAPALPGAPSSPGPSS